MIKPKFEIFNKYCEENKFTKFGFSARNLFNTLEQNGWLLPDGKVPQKGTGWKTLAALYYGEARRLYLNAKNERRKARKAEKAKLREARREEARKRWYEKRKDWLNAWTDGSCNNLSPYGEGGSAYVILKDGVLIHEAKYGRIGTSNNRMELLAIISAVNWLPAKSSVIIFSDSQYAIKVLSGEWQAKANIDLVRLYDNCAAKLENVDFVWVKGHSGLEWNEYVDQLASSETARIAKEYNIPLYTAYNSPKCRHHPF